MKKKLYDELFEMENQHWWFIARRKILLYLMNSFFQKKQPRKTKIADLGCGCGANLCEIQKQYDAIGMDVSLDAKKYCLKRGIKIVTGRLPDKIPLPENSFDMVVMSDVLEHIENDDLVIKNVSKLLKKEGLILLTVPAYPFLYTKRDAFHHHIRRYKKKQLHSLLQNNGLSKIILSHYNFWLFPIIAVIRTLDKLFSRDPIPGDLSIPPKPVNTILRYLFESEKYLLSKLSLPFGLSLIAVYKKIDG